MSKYPGGGASSSPHLGASLRHCLPQPSEGGGRTWRNVRLVVGVRSHGAEEVVLGAEVFDAATALTASSEHEHRLHRDLAPVVQGARSPVMGMPVDSALPRPTRSAKDPRACSPTWATTWSPPPSTFTASVLLPFRVPSAVSGAGRMIRVEQRE